LRTLTGWVAVMLLFCSAAGAQSVGGRVVDAETGQGVAGVRVELLEVGGGRVREVISDAAGRFQISARAPGEHRIRTSRIGYRDVETAAFSVRDQEQVVVDLKLTNAAITLDPLTIVARRVDPRHDATEEGFYSRRLLSAPIGSARVILPHDPEMANAIDVNDVLSWTGRRRGCTAVYWNGRLVQDSAIARQWLTTSVTMLEGVEYYRTPIDAPAVFRELPLYLSFDNAYCSVIALWPRTGRYLAEPAPAPLPASSLQASLSGVFYSASGKYAPGAGGGLEATARWNVHRSIALGVHVRGTTHRLSAETTAEMSSTLSETAYLLPPGERGLLLFVVGAEPSIGLRERERLRIRVGGRLQVAQRRFSLQRNVVGDHAAAITSYGWGFGGTTSLDLDVTDRLALNAGLGYDWLSFNAYKEIERPTTPTSATWTGMSFRLGVLYAPGR